MGETGRATGRRSALRAIEVRFRGMAPRDALVYFVRRCASSRHLRGEALRASLSHLPTQGYRVALELREGGRVFQSVAIHTAAIVAVCRAFETLSLPPALLQG
jgi:hypothetical protein